MEQYSNNQFQAVGDLFVGLPQGVPTSPLLTILVLREFVDQCEESKFYADDGIYMSNEPIKLKEFPDHGIVLNEKKSGYVVYNGRIIKELKFLGLTYNLETGVIRGSTRKGSTVELSSEIVWVLSEVAK